MLQNRSQNGSQRKILVTGAAGFIGFHLSRYLLKQGHQVVAFDNLNDYYDVELKKARLAVLENTPGFSFEKLDLADGAALSAFFARHRPLQVAHLAAQAGVRYSLENPHAYIEANIVGFLNILECCRHNPVGHLVYASSSSVYGANTKLPYSVHDGADHPLSLYAATKKSNELMAHTYSHLYQIPTTGLRFFTVYGPWGRPDMALFKFTRNILEGKSIEVYNNGHHRRDFTYVDDIVEGVARVLEKIPVPDPDWKNTARYDSASGNAPYRVYNIGNSEPVELMEMIRALEQNLGLTAKIEYLPMQPGDVPETHADVADLMRDVGYRPDTPIVKGVAAFVEWYMAHYKNSGKTN